MTPPRIPHGRLRTLLSRFRTGPLRTPSPSSMSASPARLLNRLGQAFIAGHLFNSYIGGIHGTDGISMLPTISHTHAYIVESRFHRRGRNIKVGDIITFTHPVNPSNSACKRVVGMPGDFVSVVTPGRKEDDMFLEENEGEWAVVRDELIRVPEGHCWVAGDNMDWSRDSRVFGALPLGLVKGKVLGVVLPWSERTWFKSGLDDFKQGDHEPIAR
ncbi:LexA/Signal peptidase [Massarina eburnea CBS 473.64]|uniref:Mitochondrial inner membrane protease subunit n=1 Tax=Massarina eburnea CBS 473.64 TaxID=1395130 RepID=A0A6A6SAW6_9PLEO|nr:LexA/Signal peptidase [Massarina eburnea CBS 473.64]